MVAPVATAPPQPVGTLPPMHLAGRAVDLDATILDPSLCQTLMPAQATAMAAPVVTAPPQPVAQAQAQAQIDNLDGTTCTLQPLTETFIAYDDKPAPAAALVAAPTRAPAQAFAQRAKPVLYTGTGSFSFGAAGLTTRPAAASIEAPVAAHPRLLGGSGRKVLHAPPAGPSQPLGLPQYGGLHAGPGLVAFPRIGLTTHPLVAALEATKEAAKEASLPGSPGSPSSVVTSSLRGVSVDTDGSAVAGAECIKVDRSFCRKQKTVCC